MNVILAGKDNAKYLKNNIEVNTPYKKYFKTILILKYQTMELRDIQIEIQCNTSTCTI